MRRWRWTTGITAVLLTLAACGTGRPPTRSPTDTSHGAATSATVTGVTGLSTVSRTSSPNGPTLSVSGARPLGDHLAGVTAITPDDAWAVGDRSTEAEPVAGSLVEHWDGRTWRDVTIPDVGPVGGVSASGARDVWAFGNVQFLHFDGAWSVVPNRDQGSGQLAGIAAVGPDEAWAVGTRYGSTFPGECGSPGRESLPLVERWDGTAWHRVETPRPAVHMSDLLAVAADGPNDAWAVGQLATDLPPTGPGNGCANGPSAHERTLAMHWDGSAWSIAPTPSPGEDSFLRAVSVSGPDDAWAVGHTTPPRGHADRLFLHWDGKTWTRVPGAPTTVEDPGDAEAVVTLASTDAWSSGIGIQHWDGSSWTNVTGTEALADLNGLGAMSASGASDVWAVGTGASGGGGTETQGVTAHWDGTAWTEVPAAPFDPAAE